MNIPRMNVRGESVNSILFILCFPLCNYETSLEESKKKVDYTNELFSGVE